jgi:hypothetical protein
MNQQRALAERRVDAFVAARNASGRERLQADEVPLPCRISAPDLDGNCEWRIAPRSAEWLGDLEARLPWPFPPTFHALVSRYCFPSFTCGPLTLYSVGLDAPADASSELRLAVLRDEPMIRVLWSAGYLPFARPADWSYDPVCFDCRHPTEEEPALVRIDHEEALIRQRVRVVEVLSPGFDRMVGDHTEAL